MRNRVIYIVVITALMCAGGACTAIDSPAALPGATVMIEDRPQSLTIDNGVISMTFDKEGRAAGSIRSLVYRGRDLLGNGGQGYVQVALGGRAQSRPAWRVRVSRHEPALVEVEVRNTDPACPFDLAASYVVRAGDSGFFNYLSMGHDAARHPGVHVLQQYNLCLRVDPELFTIAAVDQARIHPFPPPAALTRDHMVMDATYRLGAALLCGDKNLLTLEMPAPARSVRKRLGYPAAALLWDCLRLEFEPQRAVNSAKAAE